LPLQWFKTAIETRPFIRRLIVASLKEFLAGEAEKLRTEQSEAMTKREEWIAAVDRLLAQIKDWLEHADEGRILIMQESSVPISEQGIGTYEIRCLTLG
jgi:predicted transcriptional regulator